MRVGQLTAVAVCVGFALATAGTAVAQEAFMGEIRWVGFNFAPKGWALCDGQIMPISQNTALFSLLGTTYGGNGQTTFALPDMRGRAPIHQGSGPGLSQRVLGESGGTESVTLTVGQMPSHTHDALASSRRGLDDGPAGKVLAKLRAPDGTPSDQRLYRADIANVQMGPAIGATGGGAPHENMPPFNTLNCIIAIEGIFPSPN